MALRLRRKQKERVSKVRFFSWSPWSPSRLSLSFSSSPPPFPHFEKPPHQKEFEESLILMWRLSPPPPPTHLFHGFAEWVDYVDFPFSPRSLLHWRRHPQPEEGNKTSKQNRPDLRLSVVLRLPKKKVLNEKIRQTSL